MRLKDIENSGIKKFKNEVGFDVNVKNSTMGGGKSKVQIYIEQKEVNIARLAFVLDIDRALFSGVSVKEEFRKMGFATRLFREFEELAEINDLDISETTSQKKPFVCYLLKKWGYSPLSRDIKNRVNIVVRKEDGILLNFEDKKSEEKYVKSINNKLQPEVKMVEETPADSERLYLKSVYKKIPFRGLLNS